MQDQRLEPVFNKVISGATNCVIWKYDKLPTAWKTLIEYAFLPHNVDICAVTYCCMLRDEGL